MKQQLRKQQFKSLLLAALAFVSFTASAQVEINETNFPDANFRAYLLRQSYGEDGVLTEDEMKWIDDINVSNINITSLKGIEYFLALTNLFCDDNQLTSLDVSHNSALKILYCTNNQLTSLDASNCTALTTLMCFNNQLTTLNVSNCTALTELYCGGNQLTALDISSCAALEILHCYTNQLVLLDVSHNSALTTLLCDDNQLTSLDISKNAALETLTCDYNQLADLDISKNNTLTTVSCANNLLTSWDVSQNTALTALYCDNNQLTSLDVSHNTALLTLVCSGNQLSTLDVSNNPALTSLGCYRNAIKGASMDSLIESLPQNTTAENYSLRVYDNSGGAESNVCTKSQVAAAKAKGWIPQYWDGAEYQWLAYEGSDDESTNIMLPNAETKDTNIYDLSGKRVNNLQGKKGIYIIGGKKVLKK